MAADDDAKRSWVLKVLGIDLGQLATVVSMDDIDAPNRLATAARSLESLKAEGAPELPDLLTAQAAAVRAVESGTAVAIVALDNLEKELSDALSRAKGRDAARVSAGSVEHAKLRLRWHGAQTRVAENLQALSDALLADPDITECDGFEDLEDDIRDLPYLIPDLGEELDDLLDAARSTTGDKAGLHRQALKVLARYRKELGAVSALRDLEPFSAQTTAGSVRLFSEFSAAISELEAELSKAL